jgi:phosphoribosylglycinamide formyltransferase-1
LPPLHNLIAELTERWSPQVSAEAQRRIEAMGFSLEIRKGADDRTLAWIDQEFGGSWSSEAFVGTNIIVHRGPEPVGFATIDAKGMRFHWLRGIALEPGVGIFGPFGIAADLRSQGLGDALLVVALCELKNKGYTRVLLPAVGDNNLVLYYLKHADAHVVETFELFTRRPKSVRTLVLASGSGTNFQAVIDRSRGNVPLDLVGLVTNHPEAYARERATRAGIRSMIVPWHRKEQSRADYDAALLGAVERFAPELILLLGWMHLLAPDFVEKFSDILNIHPAFLPLDPSHDDVAMPDGVRIPAFRGAYAVRDALDARSPWVGASLHRITNDTDRGPILTRKPLAVEAGEDDETLMERLHPLEHDVVERGIRRWLLER